MKFYEVTKQAFMPRNDNFG